MRCHMMCLHTSTAGENRFREHESEVGGHGVSGNTWEPESQRDYTLAVLLKIIPSRAGVIVGVFHGSGLHTRE